MSAACPIASLPLARLVHNGEPVLVEILSRPNQLGQVKVCAKGETFAAPVHRLVPDNELATSVLASSDRFVTVTAHADARYQEHQPGADRKRLLAALAEGIEIDREMANYLTGRRGRPIRRHPLQVAPERYVLSPDRMGLFVLYREHVITYLRLGLFQQEFCRTAWPLDGPPAPIPAPSPPPLAQGEQPPRPPVLERPRRLRPEEKQVWARFAMEVERRKLTYAVSTSQEGPGNALVLRVSLRIGTQVWFGAGATKKDALCRAADKALPNLPPWEPPKKEPKKAAAPPLPNMGNRKPKRDQGIATPPESITHQALRRCLEAQGRSLTEQILEQEGGILVRIFGGETLLGEFQSDKVGHARRRAIGEALRSRPDPVAGVPVSDIRFGAGLLALCGNQHARAIGVLLLAQALLGQPGEAICPIGEASHRIVYLHRIYKNKSPEVVVLLKEEPVPEEEDVVWTQLET